MRTTTGPLGATRAAGGADSPLERARLLADEGARTLEGAPAEVVLAWAAKTFGGGLSVASSFEDLALVALAAEVSPGVEVVFIDTGAHFPETWELVRLAEAQLAIRLVVLVPDPALPASPCGSPGCCEQRKVAPLARHLSGRAAWVTGLRRADSPERRATPVVHFDERFALVKVNPLVEWTEEDAQAFVAARGLPSHPLREKGYRSIGCAPTTAPVGPDEPARSGRWRGQSRTECGLHLPPTGESGVDDQRGRDDAG
jgi:phosphoadenosine phosphosulfate reductase